MHGIEGRAWCYDRCMYTLDDLHMQFDTNNYKHREQNMYSSVSVYKQQYSYLHDGLKKLYRYVFHENWDTNSKVITVPWIEITCVIILIHHKRYHKHA